MTDYKGNAEEECCKCGEKIEAPHGFIFVGCFFEGIHTFTPKKE